MRKQLFILFSLVFSCISISVQSKTQLMAASVSNKYRNVFKEAGYKQAEIDQKVEKAYKDLFEGPNKIYFEVGDSMGYVSDILCSK